MKTIALASALSLAAASAFAGGYNQPVMEQEPIAPTYQPVAPQPVVQQGPTSSVNPWYIAGGVALLAVIAAVASND